MLLWLDLGFLDIAIDLTILKSYSGITALNKGFKVINSFLYIVSFLKFLLHVIWFRGTVLGLVGLLTSEIFLLCVNIFALPMKVTRTKILLLFLKVRTLSDYNAWFERSIFLILFIHFIFVKILLGMIIGLS